MSLHLNWITIRRHIRFNSTFHRAMTFEWTIVGALSKSTLGKGSREYGFLAVNVSVLILFDLVPIPLGDASPILVHHQVIQLSDVVVIVNR